jgi:protein AroM
MRKKVFMLTIGQAPREDVAPIIDKSLGSEIELIQSGVLDDLSNEEIHTKFTSAARASSEYLLTTHLHDGTSVVMDREQLEPMLQTKIDQAEQAGFTTIWLLCTGEFPNLQAHQSVLLEPDKIITPLVKLIIGAKKLGVVVPLKEQLHTITPKFEQAGIDPVYVAASPYTDGDSKFKATGEKLKAEKVDYILMDCMGYNEEKRSIIETVTGKPTILSNELMAKVVSEFV